MGSPTAVNKMPDSTYLLPFAASAGLIFAASQASLTKKPLPLLAPLTKFPYTRTISAFFVPCAVYQAISATTNNQYRALPGAVAALSFGLICRLPIPGLVGITTASAIFFNFLPLAMSLGSLHGTPPPPADHVTEIINRSRVYRTPLTSLDQVPVVLRPRYRHLFDQTDVKSA